MQNSAMEPPPQTAPSPPPPSAPLNEVLLGEILKQLESMNAAITNLTHSVKEMSSTPNQFYQERIKIAVGEAYDLIRDEMKTAVFVGGNRMGIKRKALEAVRVDGAYLEMGVYKGDSINYLASLRKDKIFHGFDSFEGLPEPWSSGHTNYFFDTGHFKTAIPETRENVRLYKGLFQDSLPAWKGENPGPIAFLHVDCDLYSSTACTLEILANRIVPGTIIAFDEFFGYYEWSEGEYKAFMEFSDRHNAKYEYLYYRHDCVVVRITDINSAL